MRGARAVTWPWSSAGSLARSPGPRSRCAPRRCGSRTRRLGGGADEPAPEPSAFVTVIDARAAGAGAGPCPRWSAAPYRRACARRAHLGALHRGVHPRLDRGAGRGLPRRRAAEPRQHRRGRPLAGAAGHARADRDLPRRRAGGARGRGAGRRHQPDHASPRRHGRERGAGELRLLPHPRGQPAAKRPPPAGWRTTVYLGYQGSRGDFPFYDDHQTEFTVADDQHRRRQDNRYDQLDAALSGRWRHGGLELSRGRADALQGPGRPAVPQPPRRGRDADDGAADRSSCARRGGGSSAARSTSGAWSYGLGQWQHFVNPGGAGVGEQDRDLRSLAGGVRGRGAPDLGAHQLLVLVPEVRLESFGGENRLAGQEPATGGRRLAFGLGLRDEIALLGDRLLLTPTRALRPAAHLGAELPGSRLEGSFARGSGVAPGALRSARAQGQRRALLPAADLLRALRQPGADAGEPRARRASAGSAPISARLRRRPAPRSRSAASCGGSSA